MNNINYIIINGERYNSVISAIYEIESLYEKAETIRDAWISLKDALWYLDTLEDEDMDITMTLTIDYPQKEWSGDYTDSIENIKRRLESWKD